MNQPSFWGMTIVVDFNEVGPNLGISKVFDALSPKWLVYVDVDQTMPMHGIPLQDVQRIRTRSPFTP